MCRTLTLIVLWCVAVAMPLAQTPVPPGTGSLGGIVTDMAGGAIPGVAVTATNGAIIRSVVTNSEGRFAFMDLPLGWYRVEAVLAGFTTVVRDPVSARAGAGATIAIQMQVGRLAIVDYISFSPAAAATHSTVIAHVRLLSSKLSASRDSTATEWAAEVLETVKDPSGLVRDRRIRFWQPDTGMYRERPGQELVAFLARHSDGELYAFPHNMIEVRSGIAQWREDPRDGTALAKPIAMVLSAIRRLVDQAVDGPGKEKELSLKPGIRSPWPGTRVGHSREFSNDIYGMRCSPIATVGGRVLLWIARLHITSGRVFVEPCEELDVNLPDSKAPRPAAFADWIFEATMGGDETYPQIQLRRLALPGWGYQSNGAFCGRFVAYWSLERDPGTQAVALHARIADLFTQAVVSRERLGAASIETDSPGAFETPVWDDHCRVATMSGKRYGLKIATLTVAR